jgi:hypothetical protein
MLIGDILLFKGNGLFSKLITALPGADYSHVGLYVLFDGVSCVFESTSLGTLPDIITGQPINGVQLVPFKKRVETYDGEVFYREVIGGLSPEQLDDLRAFILAHHGKPYEQSNWELVSAELDHLPWHMNKPDDSSLFCSETTAMALRVMNILQVTDKPANEFTPSDFAGELALNDGYSLGNVVQIR